MPLTATTRRLPLPDLAAHPDNPKAHNVPGIADSIRRFGFIDPVVVDRRTGLIAGGHGRVEALHLLRDTGADPPAGITTNDDGAWLVPIYAGWASANDTEAQAALIALNAHTEAGGWNPDALADLLSTIADDTALALEGIGYDADDLAALIDRGTTPPPPGSPAHPNTPQGDTVTDSRPDDHDPTRNDHSRNHVVLTDLYEVVITTDTEDEQLALLDEFAQRGLNVRAMTV